VYPENLEITVLEIATVSTNHVILNMGDVLLVDENNVDIKAVHVVQVCVTND
jgi:hypothetical protein